jgi:hypothetical protein
MNKLSPTNFEKLSKEFLSLEIQRDDVLAAVVNMIVDKAQLQQNFCFMYAELCKKIVDSFSSVSTSASTSTSAAAVTNNESEAVNGESGRDFGSVFRARLLERCRADFSVKRSVKLEEIRAVCFSFYSLIYFYYFFIFYFVVFIFLFYYFIILLFYYFIILLLFYMLIRWRFLTKKKK